jgi:hypothetical protein
MNAGLEAKVLSGSHCSDEKHFLESVFIVDFSDVPV